MTILLLGASGQVGSALAARLGTLGTLVAPPRAQLDLEHTGSIEPALERIAPRVIINAAAYTAVDAAEGEAERGRAQAINATAPGVLAEYAARHDVLLVHYSTDYVFDGTKALAYLESDPVAPLSVYGATKLEGEVRIRAARARHLILRTSWVFSARGRNFLTTMLALAKREPTLRVVTDQVGTPTSAEWIAEVTVKMLSGLTELGTFHVAAAGSTSWFDYARHLIAGARRRRIALLADFADVRPVTSAQFASAARRPANSRLDTTRLQTCYGIVPPQWDELVGRVLDELARG